MLQNPTPATRYALPHVIRRHYFSLSPQTARRHDQKPPDTKTTPKQSSTSTPLQKKTRIFRYAFGTKPLRDKRVSRSSPGTILRSLRLAVGVGSGGVGSICCFPKVRSRKSSEGWRDRVAIIKIKIIPRNPIDLF